MNDNPNLEVVGRYNRQATAYEAHWAPVLNPMGAELVRRLQVRSRDQVASVGRVLDLGTGTGSLLPALGVSFPGALILGVDRSPGMLARVSTEYSRAAMDAVHLGIRDGCIDVAALAFMLFHLPDPVAALAEVRRTLRPGAVVGTLTWSSKFSSRAGSIWEEELDAHGAPPLEQDVPGTGHDLMDTPEKVEGLLSAAGFEEIQASREAVEHTFDLESLLALRTSCGKTLPCYQALDPDAQAACLEQARKRLSPLSSEAYRTRGNVVYAVANNKGASHDG